MNGTLRLLWPSVVTTLTVSSLLGVNAQRIKTLRAPPVLPSTEIAMGKTLESPVLEPLETPAEVVSSSEAVHEGTSDFTVKELVREQERMREKFVRQNQELDLLRDKIGQGVEEKKDAFLQVVATEKSIELLKKELEEANSKIQKLEEAQKKEAAREIRATMSAKKLVKMYSSMPPASVAKILGEMKDPEVADVLARMKESEVSAILVLFSPKRAASLVALIQAEKETSP